MSSFSMNIVNCFYGNVAFVGVLFVLKFVVFLNLFLLFFLVCARFLCGFLRVSSVVHMFFCAEE